MNEPEARDAQPRPDSIHGQTSFPALGIVIIEHMWITWAELAIEHERESLRARRAMLDAQTKGENISRTLGRETGEGLLAICSAAFAMDALVNAWARLVMDAETVAKWESRSGRKPNIDGRTHQVLLRSVSNARVAKKLTDRWHVIFEQRGDAVHFLETMGTPVLHPSGIGKVAQVHVTYGQENATSAVDLLIETLGEVMSAARPNLRKWVADMSPALEQLRLRRNAEVYE